MSSEQLAPGPPPARCPQCGAEIHDRTAKRWVAGQPPPTSMCWLCGEDLGAAVQDRAEQIRQLTERLRLSEPRGDTPALVVFGVLALLVCLGLAFSMPGVLIVLLILVTPAFIRTLIAHVREEGAGAPASGWIVVATFLSSLGIVVMVGAAAGAAFFVTFFAICLGMLGPHSVDSTVVYSVSGGLIVGLPIAVLMFRKLWPRRS